MSKPMVWVLEIWHRHGTNISAHVSEEGVDAALLAHVNQWWAHETTAPMPDDPDERVAVYFTDVADDEGYDIHYCELTDAKSIELEETANG